VGLVCSLPIEVAGIVGRWIIVVTPSSQARTTAESGDLRPTISNSTRSCPQVQNADSPRAVRWPGSSLGASAMNLGVALCAERDQILLGILPRVAAKLFVVNLKVGHRAARLTPPTVATENLLPKSFVQHRIRAQATEFRSNRVHDAISLRLPRNASRWSSGRNLKNLAIEYRSISGCPFSRLAPARKSAQIISRQ